MKKIAKSLISLLLVAMAGSALADDRAAVPDVGFLDPGAVIAEQADAAADRVRREAAQGFQIPAVTAEALARTLELAPRGSRLAGEHPYGCMLPMRMSAEQAGGPGQRFC